jgi:hypothetical protein
MVLAGEWLDPPEDGKNIAPDPFSLRLALRPHTADAVYVSYVASDRR